ncbi:energy-coupling factor ABC transporter ATP-binding protein [Lacticaseibacillus hulanensis]|uniref:energy-coupling factor ABC transporter ATP-binding protein n=1 Tax=Lacticaseibacillus hulanensis TaxID=2493111 RepID=UPI000FDBA05B|nr:energy-coupling factor ABC transporter ATP-binding protein [Lacticaseibacillus hulanensis]
MADDIITVEHLRYTYQDAQVAALDDVSLRVPRGTWVSVIGHNGSGKSTLAKNILGLLEPDAGVINVDGMVLSEETVWDIRSRVGIVFQNPENQFVGATVADDVAFGLENHAVPREEMLTRVDDALNAVRMREFANREPAHLSGGQKQRVAIAGVVAQQPQIIILDEATSMLDPAGRKEILALIRELKDRLGLTVLSITHDLDEAAGSDQLIVLDDGHVVETGKPSQIFAHGTSLVAHGLDVPYSQQLRGELGKLGIEIPGDYYDDEGLVDYLWTLRSTM